MTDDEAATLLGIAYSALLMLPWEPSASLRVHVARRAVRDEIAHLRHRTPEDIQNEFEGKGR